MHRITCQRRATSATDLDEVWRQPVPCGEEIFDGYVLYMVQLS